MSVNDFSEVTKGFTQEEAIAEAKRCINCKKPLCISGCPVGIDIPGFISKISEGNFAQALAIIKEKNNLPAICGRVCPQETQCEKVCVVGKKSKPVHPSPFVNNIYDLSTKGGVHIGMLERFAADWGMSQKSEVASRKSSEAAGSGQVKVAVIGSGPAGLTCAADLARAGISVTVFEALHSPGGVLRYGIPTFRLPAEVLDYEIESLLSKLAKC